jgi:predicted Zn-ribbon and HTH transcriptional regulator
MTKKATEIKTVVKPLGSVEITVLSCVCRCGHEWITRNPDRPLVCPKCKSPRWDKPKLYERKGAGRGRPRP